MTSTYKRIATNTLHLYTIKSIIIIDIDLNTKASLRWLTIKFWECGNRARSCSFKSRIIGFCLNEKQCLLPGLLPARQVLRLGTPGVKVCREGSLSLQRLDAQQVLCNPAVPKANLGHEFKNHRGVSEEGNCGEGRGRDRESRRKLRGLSRLVITYRRRKVK